MSPRARSAIAYVALFAGIGAHAPYLLIYYRSLGLGLAETGAAASISALAALAAAPAWGQLSDRMRGSPAVFIAATVTALVGTATLAGAGGQPGVVAGASLVLVGLAGMSPILDARALETSGRARTGYGGLRAWGSVSYIGSSFLTGVAVELWGIRTLFVVLGAAVALTGIIGLTLAPAAARRAPLGALAARRVFGRGGLAGFLVAAFVTWAALVSVMAFYGIRLEDLGAPATVVGLSAAVGAAVEVPVMVGFSRLSARFGHERLLVLGATLFVCRALLAGLSREPAILVLASAVGGVGFALFVVGSVTHVARGAPGELAATAQGMFQGVSTGLGQVVAVAAGGAIAARAGLADLYLISAAVGALGVALVARSVGCTPGRGGRRIDVTASEMT